MNVLAHSYVDPSGVFLNGQRLLDTSSTGSDYLKAAYTELNIQYPKFYKMDNLSKLSIVAVSILQDRLPSYSIQENNLSIVFANSSSSQVTDLKFIDSYERLGNPSPSLFVYTLPSIVTGELAIRYKWFGESVFFLTESFDADFFLEHANLMLKRGHSHCLCGWVESNGGGTEECFLFLVSNDGHMTADQLLNIFKTYRHE